MSLPVISDILNLTKRWGGEEFGVILPQTRKEKAATLASRICDSIAGSTFSSHPNQITVSIGIASIPDPEIDTTEKMVETADFAMYQAKSKGGNRIEIIEA